jgi:hypothetical protein
MDKTKIAMTQNMQNLLARDEKLDTMLKKTETMSDLSYSISKKVYTYFYFHLQAFYPNNLLTKFIVKKG